ncbi:hypothetical protein ASPZODRAFT_153654 [Penicilliopsis zonata CBS 506.65]|uniref:Mediator of RNA polymerase II transcription subunit 5 n=1 Tax=Penicilliopsis zonata CBS 506.65 TaxID=1073090 RepID=A0A1L9SC49_9EURO|nr:hypothetical protein ASPZODRAFT_153654 [Penicilliopsis zonata CBS 506.65]OJJ44775.1 hypothetical protein ASPZODRAFT_153654 [Penicilliopsis zonata CBS 506.65]
MGSPEETWSIFLQKCLVQRIEVTEFKDLASLLVARIPIAEPTLLDLLLACPAATGLKFDPLLPLYLDSLCRAGVIRPSIMLAALLKHASIRDQQNGSRSQPQKQDNKPGPASGVCTFMTDIKVLQNLMMLVSTGVLPKSTAEAAAMYAAIVDWIMALVDWHNNTSDEEQQTGGLITCPDAISLFESLGILLAALSGVKRGLDVLSHNNHEALRIKIGKALSSYLPLCDRISLPLRTRLDGLQKEFGLYGEPTRKPMEVTMIDSINVNALEFEASVMDGPVINSRAGLYIYINAMLVGRPLVDDGMLINYLNNRYGGNYEFLVEEVITAAFDILSNAMYRNESSRTMFLFRSFLVNKLPSFFAAMSATSMVPMEMCIRNALGRIDPNAFPSFSQMFSMQGSTVLSDVRQEFLFACALHRLIPESSIERLLGENPMQTLPVGGQYMKDELVAQINANPERADQLINEVESMDGNAGTIVGAITEVMHNLCTQKETMTLKNICNSLSRRPQALDVILLFRSPKQVLQPICSLLDSWHWDEDQSENQPVYDEFGSILLLVLAFKYRYDLTPFDLGVTSPGSFILRLLDRASCNQKLDDLSEQQNKNLGGWIGALFIAEGISEETMSACSPQEFYQLVSTLFSQSLGACEAGKLEFETLKGGFEYLLEPFLLPSLVVALTWLGNHIWESESDATIPLRALYSLVKPPSISGEAEAIHRTVLNITAQTLEEQLKDVRARHPTRSDIKPILDALEPYVSFQRIGACRRSELDTWTTHANSGLLGSIRSTFQSLVLWSANPEITISPHSYTHRQLLAGIHILGSARVLPALVDEVKLQTETGSGDIALDIAATMICAPMAESFAVEQSAYHSHHHHHHHHHDSMKEPLPPCPVLTLRDVLKQQHNLIAKLAEKDPLRAQVLVRLFRRVNHLMLTTVPSQVQVEGTVPVVPVSNLDVSNIIQTMQLDGVDGSDAQMNLEPDGAENIDQMFDKAAAAAAAAAAAGIEHNTDGSVAAIGLDGTGAGLETSLDDMLTAADMAVGNPEFLDLDMEGMF